MAVHLVIVGLVNKNLSGHETIRPSLPSQLEFVVQVEGCMLVDWQRFGQTKVRQLHSPHVKHQRLPAHQASCESPSNARADSSV